MSDHDEQELDAIAWKYREKRYRECTHAEVLELIAELVGIGDGQAERVRELEQIRAYQLSVLDQYDAHLADTVGRLERHANGGAV